MADERAGAVLLQFVKLASSQQIPQSCPRIVSSLRCVLVTDPCLNPAVIHQCDYCDDYSQTERPHHSQKHDIVIHSNLLPSSLALFKGIVDHLDNEEC